jgi:hypothetical protein
MSTPIDISKYHFEQSQNIWSVTKSMAVVGSFMSSRLKAKIIFLLRQLKSHYLHKKVSVFQLLSIILEFLYYQMFWIFF